MERQELSFVQIAPGIHQKSILSFLVGEWCDLVSWIPRNSHRPNFAVVRVYRDRAFWDVELRPALEAFSRDLAALRAAQASSEPS